MKSLDMITDYMRKFLILGSDIRGVHVCMPQTIASIMQQHHYPQALHNSLGSCLVSSVLLINRLKISGELSLQLEANDTIDLLVAKCNDQLHVRGLAQWNQMADSQQLEQDFFNGRLAISIKNDSANNQFQSIVELNGKTVEQALEHYFLQSEQLPTLIKLDVDHTLGSGLLLQRMPDSTMDNSVWLQFKQQMSQLAPETLALPSEHLLAALFPEQDIELYEAQPVQFKCS